MLFEIRFDIGLGEECKAVAQEGGQEGEEFGLVDIFVDGFGKFVGLRGQLRMRRYLRELQRREADERGVRGHG